MPPHGRTARARVSRASTCRAGLKNTNNATVRSFDVSLTEGENMEYRSLGNTGLMVSELCLGCMTFGREASEEDSKRLVDRFLEAGGNFIDTADVYSKGVSEEITGRAIKGVRDDVVLATKVFFPMGEGRTTPAYRAST